MTMNSTEYLLTCVMEECAETQKLCSKAIRFGLFDSKEEDGPTNADKIIQEALEIQAILKMLIACGDLALPINKKEIIIAKQQKVGKYMEISRKLKTLL